MNYRIDAIKVWILLCLRNRSTNIAKRWDLGKRKIQCHNCVEHIIQNYSRSREIKLQKLIELPGLGKKIARNSGNRSRNVGFDFRLKRSKIRELNWIELNLIRPQKSTASDNQKGGEIEIRGLEEIKKRPLSGGGDWREREGGGRTEEEKRFKGDVWVFIEFDRLKNTSLQLIIGYPWIWRGFAPY